MLQKNAFSMLSAKLELQFSINFLRVDQAFHIVMLTSFSVDFMLFPLYVKESDDSSGSLDVVSVLPLQLYWMNLALTYRPMLAAVFSRLYSSLVVPSIESVRWQGHLHSQHQRLFRRLS